MWHHLTSLVSPKIFNRFANIMLPWISALFLLLLAYGLIGGLALAPRTINKGWFFVSLCTRSLCHSVFIHLCRDGHRCFYGAGVAAQNGLPGNQTQRAHRRTLYLFSPAHRQLWGKPMWGTWWIWDARLTSELILLFLYLGIMLFQSAAQHKNAGGRAVAILILVGFVDLPIIHYSVYWWNTLHQGATLRLLSPSAIDTSMVYPLLAMITAFMLYYAMVLFIRIRNEFAAPDAYQHWLKGARS